MLTPNAPQLSRNYGFWNEAEQARLLGAHVAIGGVGGDGFQLGLTLAHNGIQRFSIADPEVFEPENTNRVPGATRSNYGRNKAEVFLEQVHDINSDAEVRLFTEGVNPDNVGEFMQDADLVFDESELTHPEIGTAIAQEARRRGIPNVLVMNVGFAALVTSFHPESKRTFERLMGIPKGMTPQEVAEAKFEVDFSRVLPYIPGYGDLNTLLAVQEQPNPAPLPSIKQGVDVASAIGSTQGILHLIGKDGHNRRRNPVWSPHVGYMDAYDLKADIIKHPKLSYMKHAGVMALRSKAGLNPKASYMTEERLRREQAQ